ncbi:hypothetical protein D3C72_2546490 [compost metagenome]
MWLAVLPPVSMILPAPRMSPVTRRPPLMLTSPVRAMLAAFKVIALSVTSSELPATFRLTVPPGSSML